METVIRFFNDVPRSFFLFGPRGTGKSTWLRGHFPEALYLDLLLPDVIQRMSANPTHLKALIDGNPRFRTVIIDEIQRLPSLLPFVHALIEERPELRFILTGSSARKLKRDGVDLLAGRAVLSRFHPFMAGELKARFNLEDALRHGMLPLVWASSRPDKVLSSYVALYVQEEVRAEGLVRRVEDFARFLEAFSFSHAAVVNYTAIGRECGVKRRTVENYIQILQDLLLSFEVTVFTKRAARAVIAHPKLYFFDCGVYRSIRPKGPLDRPEEIDGVALEGLVAQHLRAWIDLDGGDHSLHFWRTPTGTEVDFVVYGDCAFCAIEVKNTARVRPEDLRGLVEFGKDYPEARRVLLYRGADTLRIKDILCLPVETFLTTLTPGKSIDLTLL